MLVWIRLPVDGEEQMREAMRLVRLNYDAQLVRARLMNDGVLRLSFIGVEDEQARENMERVLTDAWERARAVGFAGPPANGGPRPEDA